MDQDDPARIAVGDAEMRRPGSAWRAIVTACDRLAVRLLVGLVVVYKRTLSPLLGRQCRFHPTCSAYFREAVEKYGAIRGTWRGIKRLCRCHPWHPGGVDPP
jgi:putative membrane protein insertion efficiency factor